MIDALGPQEVAQAFSELDSDDAVDVLEDLDEEAKQKILASVPAEERVDPRAGPDLSRRRAPAA